MITPKFQAMRTFALINPSIIEKNFNHTMQALVEKFDEKIAMMVSTHNLNKDKCVEEANNTLTFQTASIAMATEAMTIELQLSNQCLQARAQSFAATLPILPTHNYSTIHPPMHNGGTLPQLKASSGFYNPSPTNNNHQGYNTYHE